MPSKIDRILAKIPGLDIARVTGREPTQRVPKIRTVVPSDPDQIIAFFKRKDSVDRRRGL